ncbi:phosphotransferase [Labrys wisconsinensis]|uniref:Aminoglycoside phosphotransferase domain-containing protein n=1 Tax=Labrys wisconsinensis TaxID=425677 RepID=A0ABU0JFN3_9HYPH|nr:phosphotransferase [Labrys wisconsinensis]MDQ0473096.1 hypothetical protein [Labrys wisconsinensis]
MTEAELAEFLRVEGLCDGTPVVETMKGGYLNQVLRVTAGSRRLVVKRFATPMAGTLFPNLPADEAEALRRLAGLRVAPDLVGFWPERSILVYAYVEGAPWSGDPAAVAALLRRKEAADPAGFRRVPIDAERILAEGDALFARCRAAPSQPRPRAARLGPPARLSLIHTDIGAGNLVGAGEALRLIDWQCPAQGDLSEDVHSFLSPAFQILSQRPPFTAADRASFLTALGREDVVERYARLRPAYAWRMGAYCSWRAEVLTDPEICARYRRAAAAELGDMEPLE